MPLKQQKNAGNARKILLMLAFFFKNSLSVKKAFLMPAQLPDPKSSFNNKYLYLRQITQRLRKFSSFC